MRFLAALLLVVPAFFASSPNSAQALDSVILDTLKKIVTDEPDTDDARGLRRLAARDDGLAQYLLYQSYVLTPRDGAGPRVSSDMLVSRAEAEAGLRAAAGRGRADAIYSLGKALYEGGPLRRDWAEARTWLEKVQVSPGADPHAAAMLGEILVFSEGASEGEVARGLLLLDEALDNGESLAIRARARALREGIGDLADAAAARTLLEAALAEGNSAAYAPLGDMLIKGEGGPADIRRGMALLDDPKQHSDFLGRALLAEIYLANELVGRQPRKAIRLMARYAVHDVVTRQKLAALLLDYQESIETGELLDLRYQEDEDVGELESAWILLQMARSSLSPFHDDALAYEIMDRHAGDDVRIAVANSGKLAGFSTLGGEYASGFAADARSQLDALVEMDVAAAWTLKAQLQRKGLAYPQDDVAATEALLKAAELGDLAGMVELADAYDEGLGIAEDDKLYVRWLREAAHRGSLDARIKLNRQFVFDTFDRLLTLREGITDAVAFYADDVGYMDAYDFASLLHNSRLDDFNREEMIAALMDGFRAGPAALEEERLVAMMRHLPQEARAEIEAVLQAEGFYQGETAGYFRPDARAALAAWVEARGPLPEADIPVEEAPPVGIAYPDIPAEVVSKALDSAFAKVETASTDDEWRETLAMLAPIARLGEPTSRFVLVKWYDQSPLIGEAVSAEEITRYGLDMLLLADPNMPDPEMEFTFTIVELWKAGQGKDFVAGFLAVLRDDDRLRNANALDDMLNRIFFIPGGCDMLLDGAREAGVEGLPPEECNNIETRDAFLVYAEKAGPSGVEAAARAAAIAEVYKVAGIGKP